MKIVSIKVGKLPEIWASGINWCIYVNKTLVGFCDAATAWWKQSCFWFQFVRTRAKYGRTCCSRATTVIWIDCIADIFCNSFSVTDWQIIKVIGQTSIVEWTKRSGIVHQWWIIIVYVTVLQSTNQWTFCFIQCQHVKIDIKRISFWNGRHPHEPHTLWNKIQYVLVYYSIYYTFRHHIVSLHLTVVLSLVDGQ